jgi:hypothetical protein
MEGWPVTEEVELATVELLGALAYGQLRSFEAIARTIRLAPEARVADRIATLAVAEHASYVTLRDHLAELTELPTAVMDRQKPHFDAYFDRAPLDDWFGASVFFALGIPLAADFIRAVAPTLPERSSSLVLQAVGDRTEVERAAISELAALLDSDDARESARHLTADLLGRALTGFQGVMTETDALKVLLAHDLEEGETSERRVKRLVVSVMEGHRRRVVELGLEDLDDVM